MPPRRHCAGTIDPKNLELLLLRVQPPLGLGRHASGADVLRFVYSLDIPLVNLKVPFYRTLYELVRRCSAARIPEGARGTTLNIAVCLRCASGAQHRCPTF